MEVLHQIWSVAFAIGIVGNLVASALWAIPTLIHLHRKIDRNHKEHMEAICVGISGDNHNPDSNDPSFSSDAGSIVSDNYKVGQD